MSLKGKTAFITGANRGIGRGCAIALAREGADVAINYLHHADEAKAVATEVQALGRKAIVLQGDVSDRGRDEEMIRTTVSQFGRLDILVANAAASVRKPFLELTGEEMARTLNVSLWGVFHCSQLAARQMVAQGRGGNIVVVSSVHGVMPFKNALPYNTAKAAVNQMALTMANELAKYRIRVNIIEPGWTDTPGERLYFTEEELREGAKRLPFHRLATAEDIACGIAFLVSDKASYITGATLRIDGGFALPGPELWSETAQADH